jgi:hypothetical protein
MAFMDVEKSFKPNNSILKYFPKIFKQFFKKFVIKIAKVDLRKSSQTGIAPAQSIRKFLKLNIMVCQSKPGNNRHLAPGTDYLNLNLHCFEPNSFKKSGKMIDGKIITTQNPH